MPIQRRDRNVAVDVNGQVRCVVHDCGIFHGEREIFPAGLAIVRAHNRWVLDWTGLVTRVCSGCLLRARINEVPRITGTAVFMVLEGALLISGLVMTFKAYSPDRA
jgi:hypothetical protein